MGEKERRIRKLLLEVLYLDTNKNEREINMGVSRSGRRGTWCGDCDSGDEKLVDERTNSLEESLCHEGIKFCYKLLPLHRCHINLKRNILTHLPWVKGHAKLTTLIESWSMFFEDIVFDKIVYYTNQ